MTSLAAASLVTSAALAQQSMSGLITKIDRLAGTIAIQPIQSGTVGAAGGTPQEYKVPKGQSLEAFHAGDKVSFSTTENNSSKTIEKLEKQKP
ncbi:copper-binding protein [Bradyrhizobium sp. ISRA443]|uniref:copper-binding protein n=1 Tax=unclassified Bradyrhizobium TaxID=2631580 RepID=UPI002478D931|nr:MULTISPECIES: copper-binding protein [unclassified Bradyrhizobium]WGR93181.1 copper-binding protein [Bradyrhizobium sp. ISRA435]WGR97698.1 copper-binding protein [Bradyrhizobium sp. ISRA436]WGS04588.1 copper-binding protein [Bradyrhizobium sp. ISRA437]WGS11469.1 copper-binding protein [Bradyrhizobium sp. ISRA443]